MSTREQGGPGATEAAIKRWDGLRIVGQRDFPGVAQSAGAARRWVLGILDGHPTATETLETLELLVSEVVTNAILHSDSAGPDGLITVRVGLGGGLIQVEVIDDGSATSVPAIRTTDDDSLSGRGLSWVDRLARAWGADHDDEVGGVVWFRLAIGHPSGHDPLSSR
ncbi:ATP-binding protein [Streptosporangium amethystogenes subsp. fukuiense]|uniref:ATP-binding protein n=1 Tax=Streptosporangium amethystogenes subsp. fukuiense TaxID=698418 RepID=A0ABW2T2C0_9ACTN